MTTAAPPEADFEVLADKGHEPSAIYRGHKADIFEGGHRVPFIVKWPATVESNGISDRTVCQTDLMATCAEIAGITLADDEGEDSYSLLPLFTDPTSSYYKREATVHHSVNGSFAIRKEDHKLIFCPGSGGWSDPRPDSEGIGDLPAFQLYNLAEDPGEQVNLVDKYPEKAAELQELMASYIEKGRSTPGAEQGNARLDLNGGEWSQVDPILSK